MVTPHTHTRVAVNLASPARRKQTQHSNWQVLNCSTPANYFHACGGRCARAIRSRAAPRRHTHIFCLRVCAQRHDVCNALTQTQTFVHARPHTRAHLARTQVVPSYRKPLIIATPKSLLRSPDARSSLSEFEEGTCFSRVIPEPLALPCVGKKVKKLIFCTGKASTPARGHVSMCAHGAAPTGVLRAAARARGGEARRGHRDRPRGAAVAVPLRSRDGGGGAVPGREGCLGAGACAAAAVLVSVRVAARLCVEVP